MGVRNAPTLLHLDVASARVRTGVAMPAKTFVSTRVSFGAASGAIEFKTATSARSCLDGGKTAPPEGEIAVISR